MALFPTGRITLGGVLTSAIRTRPNRLVSPDVAGFIARSHKDPDKVLAYPEWVSLWERNRAAAESRSKPRVAPWRVRWGYVADQEARASG